MSLPLQMTFKTQFKSEQVLATRNIAPRQLAERVYITIVAFVLDMLEVTRMPMSQRNCFLMQETVL